MSVSITYHDATAKRSSHRERENGAACFEIECIFSLKELAYTVNADTFRKTLFQRPEWIENWLDTVGFEQECTPFYIIVREKSSVTPVMVLPLVVRSCRGLRVIEPANGGLADYTCLWFAKTFNPTPEEMARLWQKVLNKLPPADMLCLDRMPEEIDGVRNPLLLLPSVRESEQIASSCALNLPAEAWFSAHIQHKSLIELRDRYRRLAKRGVLEFRVAETQEDKDTFFAAMCEQRAERALAQGWNNCLARPQVQAFYRNLLGRDKSKPLARIMALIMDGDVIATNYGLSDGNSFACIFPTFRAEKWRNYSVGLQIFIKSIEWAIQNGHQTYDFTIGAESYKQEFGAVQHRLHELNQPLSLLGVVPFLGRGLKRRMKRNPTVVQSVHSVRSVIQAWRN